MTDSELAPPVRSILAEARERHAGTTDRLTVSARSITDGAERTEQSGRVPVIAEVKPTSPTTDGERDDDPVELARAMVAGGATAISVLTEPVHFGGSVDALERVRDAVDVPVLRKDFILREGQLDAVAADLVLLIARFVDDLDGLVSAARSRGFQPLVEVHDRSELRRALETDATVIGINNRDLASLDVDLGTFERVADIEDESLARTLDDVTLVAESGISTSADVRRLRDAGADALLVGGAIMDGNVESNTRALVTAERNGRGASGGSIPSGPEVDAT